MKKMKGRMCSQRISRRRDGQRGITSQVVKNGARPRSAGAMGRLLLRQVRITFRELGTGVVSICECLVAWWGGGVGWEEAS